MKALKIVMTAGIVSLAAVAFAQSEAPLDGVYKKEHIKESKVTKYASLREADILYSKRVWRKIDLREKINLPFTYPKSKLIDVLMDAVIAGELPAYSPEPGPAGSNDDGDEFKVPMTPEEVAAIGARTDTIDVEDPITGESRKEITSSTLNRDDVIAYRIKEDWVFDKQRSIFEPRIIGIAPIILLKNSAGEVMGEKALFWIHFEQARQVLTNAEVFNRFNDGQRFSFDDLFVQRMFNSYIIKESNVYNRRIQDYVTGIDALMEAQRIKDELILYEHDLWEF